MNKKLLMLKGLPASGKSKFAEGLKLKDPDNTIVVTKDDIRITLNKPWSKELEKEVISIRDNIIREGLAKGNLVISADTNLSPHHEKDLRKLAQECGASFDVKYFDIPLEVCIERDMYRDKKVGSDVILKMYNKYIKKVNRRGSYLSFKENISDLPKAIICDIDGTLAIANGRNYYDESDESLLEDRVNPVIKNLLIMYYLNKYNIIFVTGRRNKVSTFKWIEKNIPELKQFRLYSRQEDDKRKDSIIKKEIYENRVKNRFFVEFVIDDRLSVIKTWVEECELYTLNVNQFLENF